MRNHTIFIPLYWVGYKDCRKNLYLKVFKVYNMSFLCSEINESEFLNEYLRYSTDHPSLAVKIVNGTPRPILQERERDIKRYRERDEEREIQ